MLIGIDPGHGGKDPGATNNVLNLQEKQVTLAISLWLKDFLQYNNLETLLTREEDVYLTLQERATMLNKAAVDYIISVHINSSTSSEPNYLSSHIIAKGGQAEQLAGKLQNALVKEMAWPDGGVQASNFYMLRETKAPAVLVELGFISNSEAAKQLQKDAVRQKLATALAKGMLQQLGKPYTEPGSRFVDIQGHWAKDSILWAVKQGLLVGISDSQFAPDQPITRAQLAVVLRRMYQQLG